MHSCLDPSREEELHVLPVQKRVRRHSEPDFDQSRACERGAYLGLGKPALVYDYVLVLVQQLWFVRVDVFFEDVSDEKRPAGL